MTLRSHPASRDADWAAQGQIEHVHRRPDPWLRMHPEWLVLLLAAAVWVWLGFLLRGSGVHLADHHAPARAPVRAESFDRLLLMWLAMVIAMMLPTTIPHLRYLAFNTRASRTQRSLLLFALGYVAVWLVPGVLVALVPVRVPAGVLAVALLLVGTWELSAVKRRALRRCCRTWPVRYSGAGADASAVEYGLRHGAVCLLVSAPAMVALTLAGHPWWATGALTLVMAAQKLLVQPERWRAAVAVGWLASGVAMAGIAAFD